MAPPRVERPRDLEAEAAALARQLDRTCPEARLEAVQALGRLGLISQGQARAVATRLNDEDAEVRLAALAALRQLGGTAAAAYHRMVAARLEDVDARVKGAAAGLLGELGTVSAPHAQALGRLLREPEADVRLRAVMALGRVGAEAARPVAPALGAALADPSSEVRQAAVEALSGLGRPAAHPAAEQLPSDDAGARGLALEVLRRLGEAAGGQAVAVVRCLEDRDAAIRVRAIAALTASGRAGLHVRALAACTADEDAEVRRSALSALGDLGEAAAPAADDVLQALQDPDVSVRRAAVEAFGRLGRPAQDRAGALAQRLEDPDAQAWWSAVQVLDRWGGAAAPSLAQCLPEASPEVRASACQAFAHAGAEAVAANAPELAAVMAADPAAAVRRGAASALAAAAPAHAGRGGGLGAAGVPSCASVALEDPDPIVRRRAAEAVCGMAACTPAHLEAVAKRFGDSDPAVRQRAAAALAAKGGAAATLVLTHHLGDDDEASRLAAAEALCWRGRGAAAALAEAPEAAAGGGGGDSPWTMASARQAATVLEELLLRPDPSLPVRHAAAEALGQLGPVAAPRAGAAACKLLGEEGAAPPLSRRAAAEALGGLGRFAARAAPAAAGLLLADRDPVVRQRAAEALGRMGPEAAGATSNALASALGFDRHAPTRAAAARALGLQGAAEHACELKRHLAETNPAVGSAAAEALWRLGPDGARELASFLAATDEPICKARAAEALRLMGEPATPHAQVLSRCLDTNAGEDVQQAAKLSRGGQAAYQDFLMYMRAQHAQGKLQRAPRAAATHR